MTSRIKRPGETAPDVVLTTEKEINRLMKVTIDILQQEMKTRFQRLQDLDKRFGFLLDAENLIIGDELTMIYLSRNEWLQHSLITQISMERNYLQR